MLQYTGHPLVDVGVATITAFAEKSDPAELTADDLNAIATYIEREYSKNPMKSFLTVIYVNSDFTQAAFDSKPERKKAYATRVLQAWDAQRTALETKCTFYDMPAVELADSKMLTLSSSNFYPDGIEALPVSGRALLALQSFPLGSIKCSGRVLLLHAEDPKLTYIFAQEALAKNKRYLNLTSQGDKFTADAKHPRTQIVEWIIRAEQRRQDYDSCSITGYHFTNYRTKPQMDIYHLPLQITRFLADVTDATYRSAWQRIVARAWDGNVTEPERDTFGLPTRRNVLYEDLFALPRDARRFLRTYILRLPRMQKSKDDPRIDYRLLDDLDLVSWPLTTLFLKEVMNMDETRIEAIRTMADRLADYIDDQRDQRLFKTLLYGGTRGQDYQELRTRLIRADYDQIAKHEPLFTLDQFVAVFENSDSQYTWILARDLLLIRIIERLHERGRIAQFRDTISTPQDQNDDEED